jgi:hypothetical protein
LPDAISLPSKKGLSMMVERFVLPIGVALDWFRASGEPTEDRLSRLIDHMSVQLAFPVSDDQRRAAVEHCAKWVHGFRRTPE